MSEESIAKNPACTPAAAQAVPSAVTRGGLERGVARRRPPATKPPSLWPCSAAPWAARRGCPGPPSSLPMGPPPTAAFAAGLAAGGVLVALLFARKKRRIETLFTDEACPPAGHYSQATIYDDTLYVSGLLPVMPDGRDAASRGRGDGATTKRQARSSRARASRSRRRPRCRTCARCSRRPARRRSSSCRSGPASRGRDFFRARGTKIGARRPPGNETRRRGRSASTSRTSTTGPRSTPCTRASARTTSPRGPSCPCPTCTTASRSRSRRRPRYRLSVSAGSAPSDDGDRARARRRVLGRQTRSSLSRGAASARS